MSIEQALLAHTEAMKTHSAAMLTLAAALAASGGASVSNAAEGGKPDSTEGKDTSAADKKASAAADKKAAADAKKAAADKKAADAKKKEITDERLTEVFGPLLAKGQDEDVLKANKEFVASVNAHFGVTKLRELTSQEDRAQAVEWGLARAEDSDFEIPAGESDEDEAI